jgi:hypothetical protein
MGQFGASAIDSRQVHLAALFKTSQEILWQINVKEHKKEGFFWNLFGSLRAKERQ